MINAYWLTDPYGPYATLLRTVQAHCHPEAHHEAYDGLRRRARDAEDRDMVIFKIELRGLLAGGIVELPVEALDTAAQYDEPDDLAFLRRLWTDLYPGEPVPGGGAQEQR